MNETPSETKNKRLWSRPNRRFQSLSFTPSAGALTKLCTIDSAELSELTEREWEKYEKEHEEVGELYRDAPWDVEEKSKEEDDRAGWGAAHPHRKVERRK